MKTYRDVIPGMSIEMTDSERQEFVNHQRGERCNRLFQSESTGALYNELKTIKTEQKEKFKAWCEKYLSFPYEFAEGLIEY